MRRQRFNTGLFALTLVVSLASTAVHAQSGLIHLNKPRFFIAQSELISREKAASIAKQNTGGRVLEVKLKGNNYHVKMLLNGERIRTVRIDARTGQLKNQR